MAQNHIPTEPQAPQDKHFVPEWAARAREESNRETEGMTAEEEIAYYERGARQFRAEQAEGFKTRRH
jgi:hypothetical protein